MRNRLPRLLALASSAATLLICTSPASAQAENSESKTRLLESYSKAYGVTPAESERRLRLQREIGKLGGQLKQDPNYAGHYIEHKPVYRVVAKFTLNAAATLAKYTTDPLWVAELAPVSYKELLETQSTVYALLKGLGIESVSRENVETNKVEFFVLDPAAVQTLIATGALKVPSYVTFGKANNLDPQREATIEGGRRLVGTDICTSGFTIINTSTKARYISTSGHCPGTLSYNSMNLPVQGQRWETKYDFQWHSTPGFTTPTNTIYEGLPELHRIISTWPHSLMERGDYICKYGVITGFNCGRIISLNYNALGSGGFVEVDNVNGGNLSDHGDSGGPWFEGYWHEAWGLHTDSSNVDPNDAVFMPVSSMADWGYEVLTAP